MVLAGKGRKHKRDGFHMMIARLFKNIGRMLFKNIELKLGAIIFSIILWMVAVNIDDPVVSTVFRNIPINFQNEEIITNQGKIFQIIGDEESISVTVFARRSLVERISSNLVMATADIAQMDLDRLIPINVEVLGFEGRIQSAQAQPLNVQVQIEDVGRTTFPVTVSPVGDVRE